MKISDLPVSSLAYIGDAVYELAVRLAVLSGHKGKSGSVHKLVIDRVNASAQSKSLTLVTSLLTDQEKALVQRAANHQVPRARQVDPTEYRRATGFEALIGYLYLSENWKQLRKILLAAQPDLDFNQVELPGGKVIHHEI